MTEKEDRYRVAIGLVDKMVDKGEEDSLEGLFDYLHRLRGRYFR